MRVTMTLVEGSALSHSVGGRHPRVDPATRDAQVTRRDSSRHTSGRWLAMLSRRIRHPLICLSLSNLLFLRAWLVVLVPENHYLLKAPPTKLALATCASVLGLGVLFWAAWVLLWRLRERPQRRTLTILHVCLPILLLALPLNALRQEVDWLSAARLLRLLHPLGLAALSAVALFGLLWALVRRREPLFRASTRLLAAASPFVLVSFGMAARLVVTPDLAAFRDLPRATRPTARKPSTRVVWLLFDGLDQRILFDSRPEDLRLPRVDRFVMESFVGHQVQRGGDSTATAVPSLLSGRLVTSDHPTSARDMVVHFAGENVARHWSQVPNVFTAATASGYSTALSGWYHPYCRVLRGIDQCAWEGYLPEGDETLRESFARAWGIAAETIPGAYRLDLGGHLGLGSAFTHPTPQWHARCYRAVLASAERLACDDSNDLVFVHFPVPHSPFIFDRQTGQISYEQPGHYRDNVALVDQALGRVLDVMRSCGTLERTALLVTADHGWQRFASSGSQQETPAWAGRPDTRVPFVLRLPRSGVRLDYRETFPAIWTHDLVLDLLRGRASTAEDVARWIDRRRASSH
jgi:hypothetical protein